MNCTVCNSKNTEFKFIKNNLHIAECVDCGHRFTVLKQTPEKITEVYSDDYFYNGGAGYDNYTLEKNMLIKRGEYYAGKMHKFMKPGKVLDVGAAAGFLLKGFENKGWQGTGIEPNNSMAEYGEKVIKIHIKKGTLETAEFEEKFDLVILIQVIAHLYDLKSSLDRVYRFLKPNGHVLIETWDKDSLTANLFGTNWHEYSPPGTLNYFSRKTLERLMTQYGFTLVKQGTPKKRINSSHAKSLIKYKLSESKNLKWLTPLMSLIPGNVILPYPSEDLFWALYKKNNFNGR
jgi:2-polyprenyl-3-methyl-5-hydroxy-6-metoxy-1,4-benzoquinol methylase